MNIYMLRTLYLFLYLFIASQGMFYAMGMHKALGNISISAFIEQRKSIDSVIGNSLRFLYFSSMGIAILILVFTIQNPESIVFITVLLSLLCILADLSLAIKKSIPLNKIINHYQFNSHHDIQSARNEWLSFINYRGAIAIIGLFILLTGFLIESYTYYTSDVNTMEFTPVAPIEK